MSDQESLEASSGTMTHIPVGTLYGTTVYVKPEDITAFRDQMAALHGKPPESLLRRIMRALTK